MPGTYDATAGVPELKTRSAIIGAQREGWTPALEGELPTAYISSSSGSAVAPPRALGQSTHAAQAQGPLWAQVWQAQRRETWHGQVTGCPQPL